MHGIVAAGDIATARAAADALARGGNAVDAAITGAFASFVTEPLLASVGGAGMLIGVVPDRDPFAIDFFPPAPGLGGTPGELDFAEVHIDFGDTTQAFFVGRGSVAPPLALDGLCLAASRFGRLSLREHTRPAIALAREGVAVSETCANVFRLLWPIQELSSEARALAGGSIPRAGQTMSNLALADFLEEVGARGGPPPWFCDALLDQFGTARGGQLTAEDLETAQARIVKPRAMTLAGSEVLTSPRTGGLLVDTIAAALFADEPEADSAREVVRYARASRKGHRARHAPSRGSTTHISVIDDAGAAAAITLTNGEGCGYVLRGTGSQLNNFLGEEDLNPGGFHRYAPGAPLPTMIAPTIVLRDGAPRLALGSGGANRIRSVVAQVLYRVVRGDAVEDAVLAPRIHAEGDEVWVELEGLEDVERAVAALEADFARVHPFARRSFFFGGVHAVERDGSSSHGTGDPRRGGATARE